MATTLQRIAYSPAEVATAAGVSVRQVRRWMDEHRATRGRTGLRYALPSPRCARILHDDLLSFLKAHHAT